MTDLSRPFAFSVIHRDACSDARLGSLQTPHGEVPTPVFMPVGTAGSVKAVTFEQVEATGARIILGNTYHLYLRPGHELVAGRGGLHRFLGWSGAMLTDSAGFQVFSLTDLVKVRDEGVEFRSHLDGARLHFTPELSMEIQLALGADIVMAFDECVPAGASVRRVATAVDRSQRWLERCLAHVGPGAAAPGTATSACSSASCRVAPWSPSDAGTPPCSPTSNCRATPSAASRWASRSPSCTT